MSFYHINENLLCAAKLVYENLPPSSKLPHATDQTNYFIVSGFLAAYQQSKEIWYIQAALAHIQAYLELGYSNEQNILLFHNIFSLSGISYSSFMTTMNLLPQQIHPTYNRLNSILGRWPASKFNSHKKPDAIQDILYHIDHMEPGEYQYSTTTPSKQQARTYRLIITSDSILLYDYYSYKVYSFYPT